MTARRILVVEDDADMRQLLDEFLRESGFEVTVVAGAEEALRESARAGFDVVVTDLIMPGMQGNDLLLEMRRADPHLPVVIMTAFGSVESAVEAMKHGAYYYLTKPFRMDQLLKTLEGALRERDVHGGAGDAGPARPSGIVAHSEPMLRALELLRRAAPVDTAILIQGESGTGKELLARAVHDWSARRDGPFMAINCAAIPENLLESQLFGHRRGAFTDAREERRGLFQEAEGGTIFLDEIGDLPLGLQAKLLRVLQEREVHPLGASLPVRVDVRMVAATHRDLQQETSSGRFRLDLYFRLNVIAVRVPPLRERPADLEPLVAHFLAKHGARLGRAGRRFDAEALARFRDYAWPGNVRELENAVERALVLAHGESLGIADLPDALREVPAHPAAPRSGSLADREREQILETLRAVEWNKAAAARILGLDRKTLYRKIEVYGIRAE